MALATETRKRGKAKEPAVDRDLVRGEPRPHVVAVCQPGPAVLAAASMMAEDNDPSRPASMTIMGSPIDARYSPTTTNKLAEERPFTWFQREMIYTVPAPYPGAMRRVYPGFVQLYSFMSMNAEKHQEAHKQYFADLVKGDGDGVGVAPTVFIVNLSIGDQRRPFANLISPLARLLDYLAARHNILFLVSAGNVRWPLDISGFDSWTAFEEASPVLRERAILTALNISDEFHQFRAHATESDPGRFEKRAGRLVEKLERLMREGPEVGVHVWLWADSVSGASRRLTPRMMREVAWRIAGRMSADDSQTFIGTGQAADLRDSQLVMVNDDRGVATRVTAYAPPPTSWVADVAAAMLIE